MGVSDSLTSACGCCLALRFVDTPSQREIIEIVNRRGVKAVVAVAVSGSWCCAGVAQCLSVRWQ